MREDMYSEEKILCVYMRPSRGRESVEVVQPYQAEAESVFYKLM